MENLVAIELAYINTKHPDFQDAALVSLLTVEQEGGANARKCPRSFFVIAKSASNIHWLSPINDDRRLSAQIYYDPQCKVLVCFEIDEQPAHVE